MSRDVDVFWDAETQVVPNGHLASHFRVSIDQLPTLAQNVALTPAPTPPDRYVCHFTGIAPGNYSGNVALVNGNNSVIGDPDLISFAVPDDTNDAAPIPVNATPVVNSVA